MFSKMLMFAATVAIAGDAAAGQRGATMRFQSMDRDRDGRISRAEWRGSDRAFEEQDWNGDGVLAGEEVRLGARRDDDRADARNQGGSTYDDWSERAFRSLDRNGDGRLTRVEWAVDQVAFRRADHNSDGIVTRREFLGEQNGDVDRDDDVVDDGGAAAAEAQRFDRLDVNGDGRIARDEWRDGRAVFDRLDENRDGRLTRAELFAEVSADDRFDQLDTDRNGAVTRGEWTGSASTFSALDVNRDARLTRAELANDAAATVDDTSGEATRSPGYRAGYQRGLADGRLAGREDRQRNQGFDLDGQRELETADAGYDGRTGNLADYQTGYRAAFRLAYREGYGSR